MKTVNLYMLNDILTPLGGGADIDEQIFQYQNFNGNDKMSVKNIIAREIKPYYKKASQEYKTSFKRSLSYFLTTNAIDFGRLYDSCLIAFDHPANPRDLFVWIWEVLFPDTDYILENIHEYEEVEDVNEPYNFWVGR